MISSSITTPTYLVSKYGSLHNVPEQVYREQFNDVFRLDSTEVNRPECGMLTSIAFSWLKSHIPMIHYSKSIAYQVSQWTQHNRFQVSHLLRSAEGLQSLIKEMIARRSFYFTEISFNSKFLINKMTFVLRMYAMEDVMVTLSTNCQVQLYLIVPNFIYRRQKNPKYTKYISLEEFAQMTNQQPPAAQMPATEPELMTNDEVYDQNFPEVLCETQERADEFLSTNNELGSNHDEDELESYQDDEDAEIVHQMDVDMV